MSWAVHARRVRDEALPLARRVSALHSLVASHHAPFGFLGTVALLHTATGARGRRWTGEQLLAALAMLERSRESHLAYRGAFAERRRREKEQGRRRPTAGDVASLTRSEWMKDVEAASTRVPSRRDRRGERGVG